ncbi:hypothetical protein SETIT_1G226400v2 [Setaria italica]|uniref:protein-serine/threonine phosphatase n=2 Tax=Setaria italica TaxID=4555 RepID=A0A368PNZ3_SETIT|nr:probable protein phosphatase 2C 21 [Setaria italica]RCV07212.1 hypothetical protein SETIT_1G226400v2 [Setaria italica]RCV07213.1 hypothetical protein SETIT_1G226400v2 [Setaria italica]RCV07214.1 hypothetical protein SETIT_1G226400v2 [Setaria italica]
MGASSSRDVETSRTTEGGENVRIKYAAASMQGFGIEMEDAHTVVPDLDHTTSFFGLYDGHGGDEVALLCARLFHVELQVHPNYQSDLDNAIRSVFSRMDEVLQQSNVWRELVNPPGGSGNFLHRIICPIANPWYCKTETPYIPPQNTGSSASVAVIRGNRVIVGNVGDSHCVASRDGQAIQLSTDHKPRHRCEIRRIQRAGGKIDIDQHVVREAGRVIGFTVFRGMLATSRAIGDFVFKQNKSLPPEEQIVICNPDIRNMEITNDIEFLVIASRGIWASLTCQDVVDFVREEFEYGVTDLRVICERLLRYAQPTVFDMTVILIQFKHDAPDDAEETEEDNDNQEIKSDASDGQEIKLAASDEEQRPFAPNG